MDPDLAAPQVSYREVGRCSEQRLEGRLSVQRAHGRAVFEPGRVAQCLAPQHLGEASLVPEGADTLEERPVQPFGDAIELRSVVCGEAPRRTRPRKVLAEV